MVSKKIGAIVLAAGHSTRMEKFKPLLHIGGKTLIEHVVGLFKSCGITKIITVAGHRAEDLIPSLVAASSDYVINYDFNDGMFSSVQTGVKRLKNECDACFLLPVDIPLVRPATIRKLLDIYDDDSAASVYYPTFQARRGHPPLIASNLINPILEYHGKDGLRGLLHRYNESAVEVPVSDPFILMDADTPEDLAYLETTYLSLG